MNDICKFDSEPSFLHSPKFLKYSLHIIGCLSIPIHILGFYCVFFKTPAKVRSVKQTMFITSFWACVLDMNVSFFTIFLVLAPSASASSLGFLTDFGVSVQYQTYITAYILIDVQTRNLQKKFFTNICIQVGIPFLSVTIPALYIGYSFLTEYHNQALNNFFIMLFDSHGLCLNISMILTHQSYRETIQFWKWKKPKNDSINITIIRNNPI
ncbi:unnamed protein product [Caenorhabditis angaria]|uniref:Uncharacterized protein n=1 Tax=Caenorhabditis angaria TaxID=860376 RepID=A0A9P1IJ75_9PELO|nr:unnamed protein product [Caenorhabditis angaria]